VSGDGMQWSSAVLTDVGKVRQINEDACAAWPETGIWAVADGMGGHAAGDLASSSIIDALGGIGRQVALSDMVDAVEDSLLDVNRALLAEATTRGAETTIGSTVVALLAHRNHCACLWAGDSRIYRLRDGRLQQITQDHSQVMDMVEQGLLLREDAESHPAANVVTRAVGAAEDLYLDVEVNELHAGDRYLLCSDGLTKEMTDTEIAGQLQHGSCRDACNSLVGLALERGCRDNVSVVVVDFN
jgi:serine/threonine protein phosphatase PrpC